MDIKRITEILYALDIASNMDRFDVRERIENENLSNIISCYQGASKLCLVFKKEDFVIKWTREDPWESFNDEAMKECEIYQKAKEQGLEKLFPLTEFFGEINGIKFVLQEKIDYSCEDCPYDTKLKYRKISKTATEKIIDKMRNGFKINKGYDRDLDWLWASMVITLYGKKVCKKLCTFIKENEINDLHTSNLGYKNNHPIILDFSGYYR